MALLDVKIPALGESINSGILAKWHVQDGDVVKKDQALFELETDKITTEGTAEAAGRITLKVAAGAEVKIGEIVAQIDPGATAGAAAAAPNSKPETRNPKPAFESSPAVRRVAAETGIDPATVAGTGKAGRVTKGDMLAAAEGTPATVSPADQPPTPDPVLLSTPPAPAAPAPRPERQTRRKMTPLRQRIAQRLIAAQHEAAMLTTFNEADMSAVIALRTKYQEEFTKRHGVKLGFMAFFVKAVVCALKEVPAVNTQIDGDVIVENHFFDIGVAVSTEKGLMVPVIRDCDLLSLGEVEIALAGTAKKAREGKITLSDLDGGVFTITNGGVFGSLLSTPIINSPQCAILGMHAIQDRPVVRDGQIVIRPMMYLALSYDHRLVDGREAVTFLVKVKQAIEDPTRLMLSV
ncbi:MAG TPA: 2-oxoglutarate dehydrogenase complex dihydrolipoyllysine-residue succinyltransferase [Opitutaceae bacterium]|nr:2-oxoglutarate dehydrogenase complex dihydrolipoyllysine-residue succinyltransferase [Opitutaceae bacterium]